MAVKHIKIGKIVFWLTNEDGELYEDEDVEFNMLDTDYNPLIDATMEYVQDRNIDTEEQ